MGILFAGLAIAGWGFGDFLIQRSARKLGDWEALFFVTLFAAVVLAPFVSDRLARLSGFDWLVLATTSIVILGALLLDFDALRVGKMSIVELIFAMEVPVTIALSTVLVGEHLRALQLMLIALLLIGTILVSNKHFSKMHLRTLERGVWTAVLTTIGMGTANFLYGFGSRATDPFVVNWFTSIFMAIVTLVYLLWNREAHKIMANWRRNRNLIIGVGFADAAAWFGYSTAALTLPIGITTGLTESYIALAAVLGLTFNGEKLRFHQTVGLILAVCAAIVLAFTVESL